jgi:hypothetical protein
MRRRPFDWYFLRIAASRPSPPETFEFPRNSRRKSTAPSATSTSRPQEAQCAHAITIRATPPEGGDARPAQPDGRGNVRIWLDRKFVDRLRAMRGPGESYSDVILLRRRRLVIALGAV